MSKGGRVNPEHPDAAEIKAGGVVLAAQAYIEYTARVFGPLMNDAWARYLGRPRATPITDGVAYPWY